MDKDPQRRLFYADGIHANTGGYLSPPLAPEALVESATNIAGGRNPTDAELLERRVGWDEALRKDQDAGKRVLGVAEGVDRADLASSGWGMIFPAVKPGTKEEKEQAAIREALLPLLRHRQKQAAKTNAKFYREYRGDHGYQPGDTNQTFCQRHNVDPGAPAHPEAMPYYLMLVGSPVEIPFAFQYQLDVVYAVGRIHFDKPEHYAHYAHSVVEAETRPLKLPRSVAFFGVRNPGDAATELSREKLVAPLSDVLQAEVLREDSRFPGWNIGRYYDAQASKATLGRLLGGEETPALLFTASHGVGFTRGDERQERHQGALICSDWQNPQPCKPISDAIYFSGDDLASTARLHGLIVFNFACYGGGTPEHNEYAAVDQSKDPRIADRPFISGLHRKLLGHPNGGALAAIGHIERAWSDSLPPMEGRNNRLEVFRSAMEVLMKGLPVGAAMEYFNARYAYFGTEMSRLYGKLEWGPNAQAADELVRAWTTHNDARDYVVTGDPAVRLQLGNESGAGREREVLDLRSGGAAPSRTAAAAPPQETAGLGGKTAAPSAAQALPEGVDFGLWGGGGAKTEEGETARPGLLKQFAEKVVGTLSSVIQDVMTLEVRTFVSHTSAAVAVAKEGATDNAELRAWTRILIDGDTDNCVPQVDGQVDMALWSLHVEMVKQAQAHRNEMVKMLISTVSGFLKP